MAEFNLAGKVTIDASQTDQELKKLNDKLKGLKESQQEFIEIFGEGAPEVQAIAKAIDEVEAKIAATVTGASELSQTLSSIESPDIKIDVPEIEQPEVPGVNIPVTVDEVPEIKTEPVAPVEIPVKVDEVPKIEPDEVAPVEIPVKVEETPPIDVPDVNAVNIPVTVSETPPVAEPEVSPVEVPVTVAETPAVEKPAVPDVEIPVTISDVPQVPAPDAPEVEIPITISDVPDVPQPKVPDVEIEVNVGKTPPVEAPEVSSVTIPVEVAKTPEVEKPKISDAVIPVKIGEVPEVKADKIQGAEIPVTVADAPPVEPGEIKDAEIKVKIGPIPDIEAPKVEEVEIPVKVGEMPPIQTGDVNPVEIPVKVGEIPQIKADDVPPVEIPVKIGEIPKVEPDAIDPVTIPVKVGEIPDIKTKEVNPVNIPITVDEVPEIKPKEVNPVEIPVKVDEVPTVKADKIEEAVIPIVAGKMPEIKAPKLEPINVSVNANEANQALESTADAATKLSQNLTNVKAPLDVIKESLIKAQQEMEEAVKRFGKGSPEVDKLARKITVLQSAIGKLDEPVKEFTKSLDASQKEITDTAKAFSTIPAAVDKTTESVNDLANAQQDLVQSGKAAEQNQKELGKAADKTSDKVEALNKTLKENSKASEDSKKSTGGLMTILKAGGIIGAATAAFDLFKDALMKNQKVADTVATVMKTIEQVLGAVVEVIVNVVDKVSESTNGFEALTKVLKGAITIAFTPLKLVFGGISLFIKEAQLAWENSFFGDGDPETIKQLTASIAETKEGLKETASQALSAGKDIVQNFGQAVSEAGQVIGGVVEGVSKISVSAIYDNAKAQVELQNNAKLAAAQLQGIIEKYGMQAERLRQIRDDDRKSIDDRIKANNELGEVLKKQQDAQLAQANQVIASAQADLNANKGSIELKEKLIQAENARVAVLNQIAGFQSEQLANEKALAQESIALAKATGQAETENYLTRKKNNAELITDELAKNQELQRIRNEERALEIQRLTENVNNYAQGTQARLDAEIELQNKINELDQQDAQARQQRSDIIIQRSNETKNAVIANAIAETNLKKQLLDQEGRTLREKSQEKLQLLRDESKLLIQQLEEQRNQEVAEAEKAGKSSVEIKQKYATAIQAINANLLQSEKDLAMAVLEENQQRAQAIFQTIEAAVGFYSTLIENQLDKVTARQEKEAAIQKELLDSRQITQEQYEKNIQGINEKAEKEKIKLQKKQIIAEKGVSIANIVINTLQANAKSVAAFPLTAGQPWVTLNTIQGAIGVATTIAQAAKALAALGGGGSGGGGGDTGLSSSGGTAAPAPVAPVMGSTTLNPAQFGDMVQSQSQPIRAYVVETDVRNTTERIDRIERAATIG